MTGAAWACRRERGGSEEGLSVLFVYGGRGGAEFGIEVVAAGAGHELVFADRRSADWFLRVAGNAFPWRTEGFAVREVERF